VKQSEIGIAEKQLPFIFDFFALMAKGIKISFQDYLYSLFSLPKASTSFLNILIPKIPAYKL